MSGDDILSTTPAANTRPSALNVGFSSFAERNGESSSQADSRSSRKRSHRSSRQDGEGLVTPQQNLNERDVERHTGGSTRSRSGKTRGFLLDAVHTNGSPHVLLDRHGKQKATDPDVHIRRIRPDQNRLSDEVSEGSSPVPRAPSGSESSNRASVDARWASQARAPAMDPAQLVQMALNLSESRKRHASATMPMPVQSNHRDASDSSSPFGTVKARPSSQGRSSDLVEPINQSHNSARPMGSALEDVLRKDEDFNFSPATLSRAEKARKYFEQASEYRRLLMYLPPLNIEPKLNGAASHHPSNSFNIRSEDPSRLSQSKHQQELGRQYNPIQSLRNRRVRLRDRRPFPAPQSTWNDVDVVKRWVDDVQACSTDPSFQASPSSGNLPSFPGDKVDGGTVEQEAVGRHHRTNTADSVIARPENSWTIEPSELLADAYWTEKDHNKTLMEDRRGTPIHTSQASRSVETPKISVELHREKTEDAEHGSGSDEEMNGKPSRRRKLMLPMRTTDSKVHKRLLSRTSSVSTGSSLEAPVTRDKKDRRGSVGNNVANNIGPLERYMKERIAKEEKMSEVSSPEINSPERWGSSQLHSKLDRVHRNSISQMEGRASLEVPVDLRRRWKAAVERPTSGDNLMSSADEMDTDDFSSPVASGAASLLGASSGSNRVQSAPDEPRSRRSKLGLFRSGSKEQNKIAHTDFAAEGNESTLTTIPSADSGRTRSSYDSGGHGSFRRHRTAESIAGTLRRYETSNTSNGGYSTNHSSSTVGRFFKGGRIGDLVRGESTRFGDRLKGRDKHNNPSQQSDVDRDASEPSDTENYASDVGVRRTFTDESDGSQSLSLDKKATKPKYYLGHLPSFTSSARERRPTAGTPGSIIDDPMDTVFEHQSTSAHHDRRSLLTLPRNNLTREVNASNPELARGSSQAFAQGGGKNYGGFTGVTPNNDLWPVLSTGSSSGQRQWSISNQVQPASSSHITKQDVARVRALLLSSGIKAREIQRQADSPRDPPNPILVHAAATAGRTLTKVPRKEDHLMAARMLSDITNTRLTSLDKSISTFQNDNSKALASQLDDLHNKVSDQLAKLVHDTSDEADAFVVELTTRQPQQTKQVDDAVDAMLRLRRRQFRLLRRVGFKLLEWVTLGIMWWIWFFVVMINIFRKLVAGVFRVVHWLFTF